MSISFQQTNSVRLYVHTRTVLSVNSKQKLLTTVNLQILKCFWSVSSFDNMTSISNFGHVEQCMGFWFRENSIYVTKQRTIDPQKHVKRIDSSIISNSNVKEITMISLPIFIVIVIIFCLIKWYKLTRIPKNFPPGPIGMPFIGLVFN